MPEIYEQMTTKRIKIQSSVCEWERDTHIYMFTGACVEIKGQKLGDSFSYISTHLVNQKSIFCLDQQTSTSQESFSWFLLNAKMPGIP